MIENAKAGEDDADRLYPQHVIDWEIAHGIARYVRDGVLYIECVDIELFNRKLAEEREERRRKALNQRIAEEQAAAYFGTGG